MGLAAFVREHREAINVDLMKRGYTLDDVGGVLSWDALGDFISKTEPNSALSFELDPERARWATTDATNSILADIYDMLAAIHWTLSFMASHKKPKRPTPYPRPGQKQKEKRHIGTASIPIGEIKETIFNRLRGHTNGER